MGENAQWVDGARLQASTGCKYVAWGRRVEGNMRLKKRSQHQSYTIARACWMIFIVYSISTNVHKCLQSHFRMEFVDVNL